MQSEEADQYEDFEDLFDMRDYIASHRYLSRDASASRHDSDVLEVYIHDYPDNAFLQIQFLALFRMHGHPSGDAVDFFL